MWMCCNRSIAPYQACSLQNTSAVKPGLEMKLGRLSHCHQLAVVWLGSLVGLLLNGSAWSNCKVLIRDGSMVRIQLMPLMQSQQHTICFCYSLRIANHALSWSHAVTEDYHNIWMWKFMLLWWIVRTLSALELAYYSLQKVSSHLHHLWGHLIKLRTANKCGIAKMDINGSPEQLPWKLLDLWWTFS